MKRFEILLYPKSRQDGIGLAGLYRPENNFILLAILVRGVAILKNSTANKVVFIPTSTIRIIFILLISFLGFSVVTGCGGGGGGNETASDRQPTARTAMGQFKDANVAGLSYVSGGQSGVTDSEGRFTYEVGETVMFSVGDVTLGEVEGKSLITPVDLFEQGSSSSEPVLNTVRFLISLDEDNDLSNGINIPEEVRELALQWTFIQILSDSSDFEQQLERMRSDLQERFSRYESYEIPGNTTARNHLESTLRCSYSGAYVGTYGGTDQGNFGVLIDARSGIASGAAYSTEYDEFSILTGTRSISYDQNAAFTSGNTDQGSEFSGQFTSVNTIQGRWMHPLDPSIGGSFSGERIGGDQYAVYRATGTWRTDSFDEYGVFTFDINDSGRVTGFAYNTTYGLSENLNVSLSGTNISATASDGTRITGRLDRETGLLGGRFDNSAGFSGTFEGNGCRLN